MKRHVEELDARELRRRAVELGQLRRLRRREQRRPLVRNGRLGRACPSQLKCPINQLN